MSKPHPSSLVVYDENVTAFNVEHNPTPASYMPQDPAAQQPS